MAINAGQGAAYNCDPFYPFDTRVDQNDSWGINSHQQLFDMVKLARHPAYGNSVLPAHTSWLCYLIESAGIDLPDDPETPSHDVLRQVMLLDTMLSLKVENIPLLCQLKDFPYVALRPAQGRG